MAATIKHQTIRKISAQLLPLLIACYLAAFLDRVNVSFAALTMNADLGLSATQYGFGAGLFFVTYFVFEVPSNLMLARFGARKWIARIMFGWGLVSAATAFVENATGFYIVRLLLGAAEAGFFPGLIVEALPSLILAVAAFRYLTDQPAEAAWLTHEEREWLSARLAAEEKQRLQAHRYTVHEALTNPKLLALSAIYFGIIAANVGLGFFLPQIVQAFGMSTVRTTLVSAIPYLVGTIGTALWGYRSDRKRERRYHMVGPLLIASLAMAASTFLDDPLTKIAALSAAAFGIFSSMPVFWTFPTSFLSGTAAAGGIALINSIGNLAGFAGPYVMGWTRDATGTYVAGLLSLSTACLMSVAIVLALRDEERIEAELTATVR